MAQILITDFVDVVWKSGRPKPTKVSQIKNRPDYEPAFDFYKPIRDAIVDIHRNEKPKKSLDKILKLINYPRKLRVIRQSLAATRNGVEIKI